LIQGIGRIILGKKIFFYFEISGQGRQSAGMIRMKMNGYQIIDLLLTADQQERNNRLSPGSKLPVKPPPHLRP
jgi:hypothetical protein